jgi:hypothetical protein
MFEALHLMVECNPALLASYPTLDKFVANFAARPQVHRALGRNWAATESIPTPPPTNKLSGARRSPTISHPRADCR